MSAPKLEHAPSSIENLDQLSQADLLDRRDALEIQIAACEEQLTAYIDHLEMSKDPEYFVLEQLETDQFSEDNEGTANESPFHYLIEHGEGLLSPSFLEKFTVLATAMESEQDVDNQLDTRFAPGLIRHVEQEAMALYANIDYVAVGKLEKGKSPDLPDGDGVRLREFEETLPHPDEVVSKLRAIAYNENRNKSYRYAEMQVDEIERCKEILERWGVGTKKPWPEIVYDHTELERAEELNKRYRNYHNQFSALAAESQPLLPMHEWGVNLPDTEVSKYYEHLASIDMEKELERIKISGLDLLPFEFTDVDLRDYIRTNIPAIALEGLHKVTFRNTAEDEKNRKSHSDLYGGKSVTTGHHSHNKKENSAEIVIFVDQFQILYDYLLENFPDKEVVTGWTKNDFLDTVAHEFGHALHHTLPVSILHEWDTVAGTEKAEVTSYVAEMNKHEHVHRYMEDFADSFSLSVNRPYELHNKAQQRFRKMQEIVSKLKPAA